jgi:tryptophan synthase beta chain
MPQYKYFLDEKDMPTHWYNIIADMQQPPPPYRHPATLDLLGPDDLAPVFPMALIEQEVSRERYIEIPDQVQDVLKMWRPAPLYRAARWEKALDTPARIYYKWEGVSPPGSHKPNTAIAQAYYAKQEGLKGFATETGAGQWGSALCFAAKLFDLECKVFMVTISYHQKPYRRVMMETWGGTVVPSPSSETNAGRNILAVDPETTGSLGIAISEAIEYAVTHEGYKYSLGSNAAGLIYPFLKDKLDGTRPDLRAIFVESTACPSMTKGIYAYDWGDTAKTGPVAKMHTVGHDFIPAPVHAGGLRYHGMAPSICALLDQGYVEARAYHQNEILTAAEDFARAEGFIVAPETAHAVKAVHDEAMACKESGESRVILFNASGHGHFDLAAYDAFHRKDLPDYRLDEAAIQKALAELPPVPA